MRKRTAFQAMDAIVVMNNDLMRAYDAWVSEELSKPTGNAYYDTLLGTNTAPIDAPKFKGSDVCFWIMDA